MQLRLSRQLDPAREQTALRGALDGALDCLADDIDNIYQRTTLIHRYLQMAPAHDINGKRRNLLNLALLDRNERCALRTALSTIPALEIAANCYMQPFAQIEGSMNIRK